MNKIIIIGLDGAPYEFISSMTCRGKLRIFRSIMAHGASGVLYSTVPPISPVAWTSIATGLNPGKHGIFGFMNRTRRPYCSINIKNSALWDILTLSHRRCLCINIPYTYPPYKIRGILVSGPPCPKEKIFTYPPSLSAELNELNYRIDVQLPNENYRGVRETEFIKDCILVTKARAETALYLAEKLKWDFLYIVFTTLDRVQHVFFGRALEESPFYDRKGYETLLRYYGILDQIIGKFIREFEDDAIIFIVSDHGFEPLYRYVGLFNLLSNYTIHESVKKSLYTLLEKIVHSIKSVKLTKRILKKIGFPSSLIYGKIRKDFMFESGCIYVDKPGPDLDKLISLLRMISDEEGIRIFERIYRKEELYWGSKLQEAPDLILVPRVGYEVRGWLKKGAFEDVKPIKDMIYKTGTHMGLSALKGFITIYGSSIKEGVKVDACVYDVAPTVLHILELPIPEDMDGQVLVKVFEEGSRLAKRSAKKVKWGFRERTIKRIRELKRKRQ